MRIQIEDLAELRQRLERVRSDEIMAQELAEQAQELAATVQRGLAISEGSGLHDTPWRRTGALHDSIAASSEGLRALVGSNDRAAAPQEMGTERIPPRPFLAPAAVAAGEGIARAIGHALASHLDPGRTRPNSTELSGFETNTIGYPTYAPSTTQTSTSHLVTLKNPVSNQNRPNSNILEIADNGRENKQVRDIVVELGQSKAQAQLLHREISGEGYGYHQIRQIALDMFGK